MRILTICGQKGGIGKTTLTFNIGAGLARAGKKVLLIDMDSQGNLSKTALTDYETPEQTTESITEVLLYGASWDDVTQMIRKDFYIIPAGSRLRDIDGQIAEIDLSFFESRSFDYVLFDCPPAMEARTVAAILASDSVIVPAEAASFAFDGVRAVARSLQALGKKMGGIVINKYSERLRISKQLIEDFKKLAAGIDTKLYNTTIRNSVAVIEAQLMQEDIFSFDDKCGAAQDFQALTAEIIEGE